MNIAFSPSLMCLDFLDLRAQLEVLNRRADLLHVDIMDGHFCKNITLSPGMVRTFAREVTLPMDVHLMTTTPTDWLDTLAEAGASILSVHAETINTHAFRTLRHIESLGCQKGVVLNPATPIAAVEAYLDRIDLLTIMTVDVGYAGQAFIPQMLKKIGDAHAYRQQHGLSYRIQVDGACNKSTFQALHAAGAEVFVLGSSSLFGKDEDLDRAYDLMLEDFAEATGNWPGKR